MNEAIRELQAALGLRDDGVLGPITTQAIIEAAKLGRLSVTADNPLAAPVGVPVLNDRSEASLRGVHPDLVRVVRRAAALSPVPFTVIEGLRTKERQAKLVKAGASKTMNSRHITGHAVDLVPHRPDGKIAFDWPLYHKLAPAMKQAAAELGVALVWGGDWRSFKDGPHFELDRTKYPG
ncbi:M15 family metallopeptidase [Gemmobacter denitrificans]|uniref:M15 family metallopeptidase n=1 Tax=Gemmobacter denitrificans TaxID=3123040 RepID=A0ABU8BSK7_9RHOB